MADGHKNFAYSLVATAPSPATTGLSLVVTAGQGSLFPAVPFNATVWPSGVQPTSANAEIVRVTNVSTDTFTLSNTPSRNQEGSTNQSIAVGWQIAATITAKTLTDIEGNFVNTWSPYIPTSGGTGLQTLHSVTSSNTTASMYLFPISLQAPVKFNQIIVPVQLTFVSTTVAAQTATNTYRSFFGLYSMETNNTNLTLITSNSFSIVENIASAGLTWNYPTSTATTGYGYGSFPAGNLTTTAQWSSFIGGTRAFGLQFATELSFSAGMYWMGVMTFRSNAGNTTAGLSNAGIVGQIMNPLHQPGTANNLVPLGIAPLQWAQNIVSISGWFGRQQAVFLSASSLINYGGTIIPNSVPLIYMNASGGFTGAGNNGSILPTVTFVST